jgi:hypothetical protein
VTKADPGAIPAKKKAFAAIVPRIYRDVPPAENVEHESPRLRIVRIRP